MRIHDDNRTIISIAQNSVQLDRTKHVKLEQHFSKENLRVDKYAHPLF